jgi:hypothetical protein
MRGTAIKLYDVANKAYALAALPVFAALVASAFLPHEFGHNLFRYVIQPLGAFVVLRWIGRWGWRRYQAASGLRGFAPRKAPWTP